MRRINVQNLAGRTDLDRGRVKKLAGRVMDILKINGCSVNIDLMTSQRIRALNRRYFGKDRATDVIAFPGGESDFPVTGSQMRHLGDIAISVDRARVNARSYSESFSRELARYVIHGLLHLSGETDTTRVARKKMKDKENKLLEKVVGIVG